MKTKLLCLGVIVLLALAGLAAGLFAFIEDAAVAHPPPANTLQKLDAIVVLTGGSNRLDAGFDMLEQGWGKKLFISGVYRGVEAKQLLKRWKAEPQSNLDCCVVLGFSADNTAGNAVETVDWLKKEDFHSFYLVTANYHMQRALLKFKAIAPDMRITPFPIVPDKLDLSNWWQDPISRSLILREYMKYIATYLWHVLPF